MKPRTIGRFRVYDAAHKMWDCECGGVGKAKIVGPGTLGMKTLDKSMTTPELQAALKAINRRMAEFWRRV